MSRNRIRVTFNVFKEANKCINNITLNKLELIKTYIPNQFIKTTVFVHDIPDDLTKEDLMQNSSVRGQNIEITGIERMKYFDREKREIKNSKNIKIHFRGTKLPDEVVIFYVLKKVNIFIPKPTMCRKCLRYGHVEAICKSPNYSCVNCAEETHKYNSTCTCNHCKKTCSSKCSHCKVNGHNSLQTDCAERKKQEGIKKI